MFRLVTERFQLCNIQGLPPFKNQFNYIISALCGGGQWVKLLKQDIQLKLFLDNIAAIPAFHCWIYFLLNRKDGKQGLVSGLGRSHEHTPGLVSVNSHPHLFSLLITCVVSG